MIAVVFYDVIICCHLSEKSKKTHTMFIKDTEQNWMDFELTWIAYIFNWDNVNVMTVELRLLKTRLNSFYRTDVLLEDRELHYTIIAVTWRFDFIILNFRKINLACVLF